MMNELVERYLHAVGRHLPEKGREDILRELESDIQERLDCMREGEATPLPGVEGEAPAGGGACADEAAGERKRLEALLLEFGEPAEVGRRYGGRAECLIGADLYGIYGKVLRLVLVIGLSVLSFVHLVSLVFTPVDVAGLIGLFRDWIAALAQGAMSIFATVTLSFAIAERVMRRQGDDPSDAAAGWKPDDLPPVPSSVDRIKPAGLIAGILFSLFFAGVLLLRRSDIGIILRFTDGGKPALIPIFNEQTVDAFLWVFITLLALSVVNGLWKLISGRFTPPTRILSALLSFAWAAVTLAALNQPELLDPSRGLQAMLPAGQTENLLVALRLSLRITSFAIAIPCMVEGVQHLLRMTSPARRGGRGG